jgi:predicted O-methyltransferase YrrM
MESLWNEVDGYFERRLEASDKVLDAALADSAAAAMPAISVTPLQGKFLALLAQVCNARRILEIGTLGGYSAIWMGRALPTDGSLVTLEIDRGYAAVAQRNIERAGLAERVHVVVGPASRSLAHLVADKVEPFDLVFIDADKENYVNYWEACVPIVRPGGLLVADNVLWEGKVVDPRDELTRAIVEFDQRVQSDPRVENVCLTVRDGIMLARKRP